MPERNGRARSEEIRNALRAMEDDWKAVAEATATVEQFNARLGARKPVLSWPTIAAALISKHHWLIVACDSCGTVIDLDLTFKWRDPNSPISMTFAARGATVTAARALPSWRGFLPSEPGEKLCPFSAINFRSLFTERSYAVPGTGLFRPLVA